MILSRRQDRSRKVPFGKTCLGLRFAQFVSSSTQATPKRPGTVIHIGNLFVTEAMVWRNRRYT